MNQFNGDDVARAFRLLHPTDALVELRVLSDKGTYAGYFDDLDKFVAEARKWSGRGHVYFTLNAVHPDCAARILNRTQWAKKDALTKDKEVVRRTGIYLDFDPKRMSGIASTDQERDAAMELARQVRQWLREQGFPEPMFITSGNGAGLFYRIDLPADDDGLVKRFLKALADRFDNAQVNIDKVVHNAARIVRLAGTLNCKGENRTDRPHRLAEIIEAPETLQVVSAEQLRAIVGSAGASIDAAEPGNAITTKAANGFDVAAWLTGLNIAFTATAKDDGTEYGLSNCPYKDLDHHNGGCAIFQFDDGRITASCFHAKCKAAGWGWPELRTKLDPTFDQRAEATALGNVQEVVRDPHRLARIVLEQFDHPEHPTIVLVNASIFTWADGVWSQRDVDSIKRLITRCVKAEFDRYTNERTRQGASDQTPMVTTNLVSNVYNALASLIEVQPENELPGWLSGEGWPVDEVLVCRQGIVHLMSFIEGKSDCMMQHTPRLFVTNKLDFDFDPSAPAPDRWIDFLQEVWPNDRDSEQLLQEFFGYCLTTDVSLQKFLMLIGASRGGKGTITRLLAALVGKHNCCAIRLSNLHTRFGLENAIGKSLILVPDANMPAKDRAPAVVELVKGIVGGDPLDVDRKGIRVISMPLTAKIVITSNNMIALPDDSAAIYKRMLVLKFTRSFFGKEDTTLDEKLRAELPGILLWAIEGFKRLRKQGRFTESDTGRELKAALQVTGSPIMAFVQECCIVDPKAKASKEELFAAWQAWCVERGIPTGEGPVFGRMLLGAMSGVKTTKPRVDGQRLPCYQGVALRDDGRGHDGAALADDLDIDYAEDVADLMRSSRN